MEMWMPRRNKQEPGEVPEAVETAVQDGKLLVKVNELMVWVKLSRGDYNRHQVYGHVSVEPVVPWVVAVPLETLEGAEALGDVVQKLENVVVRAVALKVAELEASERDGVRQATAQAIGTSDTSRYTRGVEVKTSVGTIEAGSPGRPSVPSAAGVPPSDDPDF